MSAAPPPAHDLASLKLIKNGIIGKSSRKIELAREGTIPSIVKHLKSVNETPPNKWNVDILADSAHIVSSLAFGCIESLKCLIECNTHNILLHALSNIRNFSSNNLTLAVVRAFRTFSASMADVVGPPLWGFQVYPCPDMKLEASSALEEIFQLSSLDIWLPYLLHPSAQVSLSIAWTVALCTRNLRHRDTIIHWLPPSDRSKEVKSKRGWERPDISNIGPSRGGGWLVRNLNELLKSKDVKIQEAALSALAALFKDSQATVLAVRRPPSDGDALLSVLNFSRSRNIDVQLAACYCATHMLRASPIPMVSHGGFAIYDGSFALTIIHVLNMIISAESASSAAKARACYVLTALARDEKEIERITVEVGSLEKVTALMVSITPSDKLEWDEDEAENTARLRESVLMATSALTLHADGIRRDLSCQPFFSCVHMCMSHPHLAVRYAACQCARVLCRSISVLRTSVIDTGIGLTLLDMIQKPDEDARIKVVALAAICNLVNDFSPIRLVLLQKGIILTFEEFLNSEDHLLRLNAMWAIKNTLFHATLVEKRAIMAELRWETLYKILGDSKEDIQEQAVATLRNLADNNPEFVFQEFGISRLIASLESALRSSNEVLVEGFHTLANLASTNEHQLGTLLSSAVILEASNNYLEHPVVEVRRAAALCIWKLAQRMPRVLKEAGIEATLRRVIERPIPIPQLDDREAMVNMRKALESLDNSMPI